MTKTFKLDLFYYGAKDFEGHLQVEGIESLDEFVGVELASVAALEGMGARVRYGKSGPSAAAPAAVAGVPAVAAPAAPVKLCQKDPSHGPMKFVPAGISKVGKPYTAFYACDPCRGR